MDNLALWENQRDINKIHEMMISSLNDQIGILLEMIENLENQIKELNK